MKRTGGRCGGWALAAAVAAAQSPAFTAHGLLLDPAGQPVVAAEVRAVAMAAPDVTLASTHTDGEGLFALSKLPADRDLWLLAPAAGCATVRAPFRAADAPHAAVVLRLCEGMTIRGCVLDAAGRPIAGAQVIGVRDLVPAYMPAAAITDSQGAYELRGVPVGDYVLRAWASGCEFRQFWYDGNSDHERVLHLAADAGSCLQTWFVGLPPAALPAARMHLSVAGRSDLLLPPAFADRQPDASGACRFTGLGALDCELTPSAPGFFFEPRSASVKHGTKAEVTFEARPRQGLLLQGVLRRQGGGLLAGCTLVRDYEVFEHASDVPAETAGTGPDGFFALQASLVCGETFRIHLAGGPWVLQDARSVGSLGPRELLTRHDAVAGGTTLLTLTAASGGQVRVRVVDAAGAAVAHARVELQERMSGRAPEWLPVASAVTGPDGEAELPAIRVIDDDVRVAAAGMYGAGASLPFRLAAGVHDVVVRLPRPGVVVGTARDRKGMPIPGATVVLIGREAVMPLVLDGSGAAVARPDLFMATVVADRRGAFRFVGVAPGEHLLMLGVHPGWTPLNGSQQPFDVPPGVVVDPTEDR